MQGVRRLISVDELADEAVSSLTSLYQLTDDGAGHVVRKKTTNKRDHQKGGAPPNLQLSPLDSRLMGSQSASSLGSGRAHQRFSSNLASPAISTSTPAAANSSRSQAQLSNFHYVSNLQRKVANLSRIPGEQTPAPCSISSIGKQPLTSEQLSKEIAESQLQVMQGSEVLTRLTASLTGYYATLEEIAQTILTHRKELSARLTEVNENYIHLFETMLSEVMRIQRDKFKSQTSLIDKLKYAVDSLEGKLALERDHQARLAEEKGNLEKQLSLMESTQRTTSYQVQALQKQIAAMEADRENQQVAVRDDREDYRAQEEEHLAFVANLNQSFAERLEYERSKHQEVAYRLRQESEEKDREMQRLKDVIEQKELDYKALFKQLEDSQYRRPRAESATQTAATNEGLWDAQNGWVLPISTTALARSRWRKCINFARCPACKGNSRYLAQAAVLFKKATLGVAPVGLVEETKASLVEGSTMKWVLPDNLIAFLSNLPPAVQAWNPRSFVWTMKMAILFLDHKSQMDEEDEKLGFRLQGFGDFVVETFLRNAGSRSQAELELFHFLCSLREHHQHSILLHLVARALHCSHALNKEEMDYLEDLESRGEAALSRKRQAQLKELKARERVKTIQAKEELMEKAKEAEEVKYHNPLYERDFIIREDVLPKEVLSALLFARRALLAEPYQGVYRQAIQSIKETVSHFKGFEESLRKAKRKLFDDNETNITFPDHVLFHVTDRYQMLVPLDRALRVVRPLLSHCTAAEMLGIYRTIESKTLFLFPNGDIRLPDGMNSFVRSTLRLFLQAVSPQGEDISTWETLKSIAEKNHTISPVVDSSAEKEDPLLLPPRNNGNKNKKTSNKTRREAGDILHEDVYKYTLLTDGDYLITVVTEIYLRKCEALDKELQRIFVVGDLNHDNVLSFDEFKAIARQVDSHCPDRKVLSMFREALRLGEDNDTIGPQAFAHICKEYDLIHVMDFKEVAQSSLSALLAKSLPAATTTTTTNSHHPPPLRKMPTANKSNLLSTSKDSSNDCHGVTVERQLVTVATQTADLVTPPLPLTSTNLASNPTTTISGALMRHRMVPSTSRKKMIVLDDSPAVTARSAIDERVGVNADNPTETIPEVLDTVEDNAKDSAFPILQIHSKALHVNWSKSKAAGEQIQQVLQQRKLQRLQPQNE
eukprot:gene3632-3977_t